MDMLIFTWFYWELCIPFLVEFFFVYYFY